MKDKTKNKNKKGFSIKKYSPKILEMAEKYSRDPEEFLMRMDGRCEWVCDHGIGHTVWVPDQFKDQDSWWSHGCDSCCRVIKDQDRKIIKPLENNFVPHSYLCLVCYNANEIPLWENNQMKCPERFCDCPAKDILYIKRIEVNDD